MKTKATDIARLKSSALELLDDMVHTQSKTFVVAWGGRAICGEEHATIGRMFEVVEDLMGDATCQQMLRARIEELASLGEAS